MLPLRRYKRIHIRLAYQRQGPLLFPLMQILKAAEQTLLVLTLLCLMEKIIQQEQRMLHVTEKIMEGKAIIFLQIPPVILPCVLVQFQAVQVYIITTIHMAGLDPR